MTDHDVHAEHPDWVLWRGVRGDGTPGDHYATRRRAPGRLPEGAAMTVAAPTLTELARLLVEQEAAMRKGGASS